jgi:4-amino-4-deoxy-L-arabinose transferase-like glycosyltransferase
MSKNLQRLTFALIVFQLVFWTLIPLIAHHAPPLDATEMYGWSLSFEWGFYKHPPMPTWLVALVQMVVGKNMFSLFLCASLVISATYYCVAWLAARFLPEKEAFVALFLYALTIYCHLWSTDFNHNQMQMPFWALSLVCIVKALDTGSRKWACILGVVMGFNALSKYTAAFIMPCAIFLLLAFPAWRKQLNWQMIALASLSFLIVFGPHLYWLTQHNFLPFHYVSERFDELRDTNRLLDLLDYLGNIALAHLCLIFAAIYLLRKKMTLHLISKESQVFIWVMGIGPVLLTLLVGLFEPLYYRWAIPMLPMISIFAAMMLKGRMEDLYSKKALLIFIILELLFGLAYLFKDQMNPRQSARGNYPAPEIANAVYQNWHHLYPAHALKIVSGGEWDAGFVSLFSPDKTYVYTHADSVITPWIKESDVHDCGMVMMSPSAEDLHRFEQAKLQQPLRISSKNSEEVVVNYAISPPQGNCQLK